MKNTIHGVPVTALRTVEKTLLSAPTQGIINFQVHDVWSGPAEHLTKTGDISGPMVNHHRAIPHIVEGDEPQPLLGTDKAISPVELLLTAVTHCVGTTLSGIYKRWSFICWTQDISPLRKTVRKLQT